MYLKPWDENTLNCPTWMLYCPPLSMSVASAFTHFCYLFISDNAFSFNLLWILWTPLKNPHSSPLAAHTIAFSFMAKERQRVQVFGQFYPLARSYPMTQNSSAANERGFGDTGVLSLSNGDTVSTVPGNQKISRYFSWQKHVNCNLIPMLWQVTILIQQQKKNLGINPNMSLYSRKPLQALWIITFRRKSYLPSRSHSARTHTHSVITVSSRPRNLSSLFKHAWRTVINDMKIVV